MGWDISSGGVATREWMDGWIRMVKAKIFVLAFFWGGGPPEDSPLPSVGTIGMIAARANVTVDLLKGKTAQKQSFKELLKKEEEANEEVRTIHSQRTPVVNTAWNNPDHERYSKWKDETLWPREYAFMFLPLQHQHATAMCYLVSSCVWLYVQNLSTPT